MKIAYILNTYPQPSHSFIRREIAALEAAGHEVLRFAMRGPDVPLVDAQDKAEEARSHYVLAGPPLPMPACAASCVRPAGSAKRCAKSGTPPADPRQGWPAI